MALKGDYLRVQTPITTDGVVLKTENGQVQYREDHLPLTARKTLEAKNARLPESLRKKITVVSHSEPIRPVRTVKPPPPPDFDTDNPDEDDNFEVAEPVAKTTEVKEQPKKKGGRPRKNA